jgi:hypothetical protein
LERSSRRRFLEVEGIAEVGGRDRGVLEVGGRDGGVAEVVEEECPQKNLSFRQEYSKDEIILNDPYKMTRINRVILISNIPISSVHW